MHLMTKQHAMNLYITKNPCRAHAANSYHFKTIHTGNTCPKFDSQVKNATVLLSINICKCFHDSSSYITVTTNTYIGYHISLLFSIYSKNLFHFPEECKGTVAYRVDSISSTLLKLFIIHQKKFSQDLCLSN